MLKQNTVLKCADCGFVTEVVAECKCETCAITCCGKPMAVYKCRNDETPEGETPTGVRFNNLAWQ